MARTTVTDNASTITREDLASFLADRIQDRAVDITRAWVDILVERLGEEPERVLPSESILNHIPLVLREIADFIRNPDDDPITEFVMEDLGALAELRRRQGFSIEEILTEFEILSTLMQQEIEDGVADYPGSSDPVALTRIVGRFKDAVFVMGTLTARRFRAWRTRQDRERTAVLSTFTAMLSHELGNRLGAAETAVRLLMDTDLEIDELRAAQIRTLILKSLGGAMDAVRDVQAISDPQGSELADVSNHRLPLDLMVGEAVRQARMRGSSRGIEVSQADESPEILVDAGRFPVVLSNLLGNAIKFHDLAPSDPSVTVSVKEHGAFWRVDVTDDGPGIPRDLQERIFEPNVRGKHAAGGSGLGLAIAREAVEQMGGSIWLESAPGRGSRFSFTIPRGTDRDASASPDASDP